VKFTLTSLLLTAVFSIVTSAVAATIPIQVQAQDSGTEGGDGGGDERGGGGDEGPADPDPVQEPAFAPAIRETPNCDVDEFLNTNNECEKIIPNCDDNEFLNEFNECEKISEPEQIVCLDGTVVKYEADCPAFKATADSTLPPCDGSYQDCETAEGFVCPAGSGDHACELSVTCDSGQIVSDLGDCPDPESVPTISTTPPPSAEEVSKGAESAAHAYEI
jgi:hypothetical protein